MGLELSQDRMYSLVSPGIPGARRQPQLRQKNPRPKRSRRTVPFGSRQQTMLELSCQLLNQLLADTMVLYDHYRRYQLVLNDQPDPQLQATLDNHAWEQRQLIDFIVERVGTLGGTTTVPRQVAGLTVLSRPSNDTVEVAETLSRLLEAHELIIIRIREALAATVPSPDEETRGLLSYMLGQHNSELSTIVEYLADISAVCA